MGFKDETVERAINFSGASTIEECLPFLVGDNSGLDHKFIPIKKKIRDQDSSIESLEEH